MTQFVAPAFDPKDLPEQSSTGYPEPYKTRVAGRHRRRLGDHAGLANFGVNLTRLDPGAESSMRHWHTKQDELIYVLEGEVTLVTDAGRQKLKAGMAAGFPAGKADGQLDRCLNRRHSASSNQKNPTVPGPACVPTTAPSVVTSSI